MIKFIDMFSGIGGFREGLTRAGGFECVGHSEIYNPPAGYAWQVVALVGEEIAGGTEIPDVPSVPEPKYYSAAWTAPAQSASGSFDLTFTVNTDKYQLNTLEKVDGAAITVTPSRTGGNVDGGSWQMSPAGAQTITTSGHTPDDNFHLNGGDGSATWTVHYEVSKTSTSTLSGQEGPFASQAEADAAAEAAKNAAIGQLQNEAQGMVDAAIAAARAQLANITFSYDEVTIPHGFDATPGALGSHQTITVPANSSNDYKMQNDEWSVKVSIDKIDSETKQRIKGNAETINCFSTAMSNASEICMNVRRARCRQVGAYLHWLYDHKYTDLDYSLQLPNFKRTAPQIPQVWSPEEIDKILAVIDTANPVGRRNYAIFLLLARTGLRISDVLGLKFSNINWKENCISLSQQKTGNALSLPLSKELGMAIISYLQDGRPQSSSAFIFLSHNAPFQPLGEHNNFNPEFHKYLRRAGIAIPTKRHTGVHTIRHSFATNMLRKGTPVQDVSQILGHSNISVTETYLRVDIEHMRLCSLSLEGLL